MLHITDICLTFNSACPAARWNTRTKTSGFYGVVYKGEKIIFTLPVFTQTDSDTREKPLIELRDARNLEHDMKMEGKCFIKKKKLAIQSLSTNASIYVSPVNIQEISLPIF